MEMDTKAVVAWYRQAKPDRRKAMIDQIAKANEVPAAEIVKILQEAGEIGKPGSKKKVETPEDNMMKPETPEDAVKEAGQPVRAAEQPVRAEDIVKAAAKEISALEDTLALVFGAVADYLEAPAEHEVRSEGALIGYLSAVRDTYEALRGPIVR